MVTKINTNFNDATNLGLPASFWLEFTGLLTKQLETFLHRNRVKLTEV